MSLPRVGALGIAATLGLAGCQQVGLARPGDSYVTQGVATRAQVLAALSIADGATATGFERFAYSPDRLSVCGRAAFGAGRLSMFLIRWSGPIGTPRTMTVKLEASMDKSADKAATRSKVFEAMLSISHECNALGIPDELLW